MRFRVINIVDSFARVNFGIWNAAINTAHLLEENHEVASELWYPAATLDHEIELPPNIVLRALPNTKTKTLKALAKELDLQPGFDIIVTHGAWQYPTKWGAWFRQHGFRWVYTPHGMLEPWSMAQKALLKKLYFDFVEGPKSRRAAGVRAVGQPERTNLLAKYRSVVFIPNGHSPKPSNFIRPQETIQFLYLARLHPKKRPIELVKAWLASPLSLDPAFKLVLAGPDEGVRATIDKLIAVKPQANLSILEGVYGQEKVNLLRQSHFYVLPSLSEGFPTSVVEAMSEGIIPLISQGCNFPDAFQHGLAINTGTEVDTIRRAIEEAASIPPAKRTELQNKCLKYALSNYSLEVVARHQAFWYATLLGLNAVQPRQADPKETDLDFDPELDNFTPLPDDER